MLLTTFQDFPDIFFVFAVHLILLTKSFLLYQTFRSPEILGRFMSWLFLLQCIEFPDLFIDRSQRISLGCNSVEKGKDIRLNVFW